MGDSAARCNFWADAIAATSTPAMAIAVPPNRDRVRARGLPASLGSFSAGYSIPTASTGLPLLKSVSDARSLSRMPVCTAGHLQLRSQPARESAQLAGIEADVGLVVDRHESSPIGRIDDHALVDGEFASLRLASH